MSSTKPEQKGARNRKQKEQQDTQEHREHRYLYHQKGTPTYTEKERQDNHNENKEKQQKSAPKNHKDEKPSGTPDKRHENEHKHNKQSKGIQQYIPSLLCINTILLVVCILALGVLTAYVWQMDRNHKSEIEELQKNVTKMNETITGNTAKLTNQEKEIRDLTDKLNNAPQKQQIDNINSKIVQLDTKIETKCKSP